MRVEAGDVLLFRGRGFVSKAIRFLDGSEVNHAAIALSDTQLAEATGHGLDVASIGSAVERNDYALVRRTGSGDASMAAVARAQGYLSDGVPYAYQQIILLVVLCSVRRIPIDNWFFRRALRRLLESAAELINAFVDRGADVMICSEYVYRAYRESGLDLLPQGLPDLAAAGPTDGTQTLPDWLEGRPSPVTPAGLVPSSPSADPEAIAAQREYELDELFGAYFAAEDPTTVAPMSVPSPTVPISDDELVLASAELGAAAQRLAQQRDPGAVAPMSLAPADAVALLKGLFSTNANFVTPRDLLFTSALSEVGRLP